MINDPGIRELRPMDKISDHLLVARQTSGSVTLANVPDERWSIFQKLFLIGSFALFIGYYSLCSFRVPWLGDFNRHVAAVHALYKDFRHPMHEAMPVDGKYTEEYNPLNVAAAVVGSVFHLSGYGALQWIGVLNLFLYAYAIFIYFRTTSIVRNSALPPVFFLVFSLFLRNSTWCWASETSFDTLTLIQAYPSLLGWSLALLIFALVERLFATRQHRYPVTIALLFCVLILTHLITASWVFGILCVRGIFELCDRSKSGSAEKKRGIFLLATAVLVGCGLPALWPYAGLFALGGYMKCAENSPFGSAPFSTMSWLYFLSIPSLVLISVSYRQRFLLIGFLATFGAFCAFRIFAIDYGDRYVFFMPFFAQVMVAEAAAIGVTGTFNRNTLALAEFHTRAPRPVTLLFFLIGIVGLIASFYAPPFRTARATGTFPGPLELWKRPNATYAFYANYGPLKPYLSEKHVVLLANSLEGYALAATTGARSVVVIFGSYVPDYEARARDVERFLRQGASFGEREMVLKRYHVSHILLLTHDNSNVVDEMKAQFGPSLFEDEKLILFIVKRNGE